MEQANILLNEYIIILKQSVLDMKHMTEEEIFDKKIELDTLFFNCVDSCEDGVFIKCIKLRRKEFNGLRKWQRIFRDIYYTALSLEQETT